MRAFASLYSLQRGMSKAQRYTETITFIKVPNLDKGFPKPIKSPIVRIKFGLFVIKQGIVSIQQHPEGDKICHCRHTIPLRKGLERLL